MAQTERIAEWTGGTLAELMAMIEAEALPVRIDVLAPGPGGMSAGEIHILAGGLADAFAGSLRRDDAVAALGRLEGARFLVETRLPDAETGSLVDPAPDRGSLTERPLTVLMRYCENYVLTCQLNVQKGAEQASIQYRKGEIIGTEVNGSDAPERLPEVLRWTQGNYVLLMPKIPGTHPVAPTNAVPSERKRHATLPMMHRGETPRSPQPASPPLNSELAAGVVKKPIAIGTGLTPTPPLIVNPPLRSPMAPAANKPLPPPQSRPAQAPIANKPAPVPPRTAPGMPPSIPPQSRSAVGSMKAAPPTTPLLSSPPAAKAKAIPSLAVPVSQRSGKVLSSNDLKPTSGVIATRPGQRPHLPPEPRVIELPTPSPVAAPKPPAASRPPEQLTPAIMRDRTPKEGRRKSRPPQVGRGRRAVRAYFYVGLALAIGVLLTYWWVNWYLPFDNH